MHSWIGAVGVRDYCIGCFGMLPGIVAFVYLGSGMEDVAGGGSSKKEGAWVDIVVWVLGSAFGIIGMVMGGGIGVGLAILGKIWKGLSHELAWALAFVGVITPLGLVIARYVVNKGVFQERGGECVVASCAAYAIKLVHRRQCLRHGSAEGLGRSSRPGRLGHQ